MMLRIISVSLFLFGATVGWLIVYFVRKYKEHNPKGFPIAVSLCACRHSNGEYCFILLY